MLVLSLCLVLQGLSYQVMPASWAKGMLLWAFSWPAQAPLPQSLLLLFWQEFLLVLLCQLMQLQCQSRFYRYQDQSYVEIDLLVLSLHHSYLILACVRWLIALNFQVVLVPITLGLVLNTYAKPVVSVLEPVMPIVAMICTSLCIGSPLAINQGTILSAEGLRLVGPVLLFHAVAFTLGYWISKVPFFR